MTATDFEENMLKQQLETSKSHKDCTLDIKTEVIPSSEKLTRIIQADRNHKSYKHTVIMVDEIGW